MKVVINVPIEQLGNRMAQRARRFPEAVRKGMLAGAMRSLPIVHDATRDAPPANPKGIGAGGAVDTANYLQSWRSEGTATGVHITNLATYSAVIEFGRRRGGGMPPLKFIEQWAKRRLGLDAKEAHRAAYPIALSIVRRGLVERRVISDKLDEIRDAVVDEARKSVMSMMANP